MLHISNLSHTYPNGVRALGGIALDVPKGMFGLLGPNGAGKSTLMRCLAALQKPTTGAIQFGAVDVLKEPDALRQVLGYLPQDFGVYPRISAQAMLDHLAVLKGVTNGRERKELVAELLRQVNLYDVRKKSLAGFSGGMRQRLCHAKAL
ncbi:MAG: ATP-binding cassette domain-containing protein, partial [Pseudomonadota bacterium]